VVKAFGLQPGDSGFIPANFNLLVMVGRSTGPNVIVHIVVAMS